MFRKFRESPYTKIALMVLLCGALLIMFHNWVSNTKFSVGFETVNSTLAPFYIGIIFAFILCPVYNECVKFFYKKMVKGAGRKGFSLGSTIVHHAEGELPVTSEDKRRILTAARAFSTMICVVLVVGLVGLLIYFVVPTVVQNGINLANTLPERLAVFSDWLDTHFSRFPLLAKWVDNIANAGTNDIIKWVQEHILAGNAMTLATMISTGVLTAVKYVTNAFIGLLIMVYLLNYKEKLFAICRKLVAATCGQRRQENLYEFADIVNETFIGFIVGRIIDSFIIGVLTFLTLKICGIQFALMISVIVGITNIIPFFGPFIGAIPSVLILLLEEPVQALYFIIIIIIIQQIDGNIIGPKIVGNAIGISSFWVLVAVLIGGGVFGFGGMALGVPVFAVFYRYVNKITTRSLKKKNKEIHSVSYMSLEQFGINDDEIELEPEKKKQESIFVKIKRKLEQEQDKKTSSVKPDEESEDMDELWSVEHPVGEPRHKSPKVYSHIDGDKE
ncbi:MAG: AI-2E family transporter [Mogibacterium sp.]|nr:AI-2E family transporter [Mogibacterium sp.]